MTFNVTSPTANEPVTPTVSSVSAPLTTTSPGVTAESPKRVLKSTGPDCPVTFAVAPPLTA